uniref:Uncharacterized protein n=1 Tax=Panagrolaimus sp. JU765 TaxID=591449 RepID=A0AC34QSP8_9BILA
MSYNYGQPMQQQNPPQFQQQSGYQQNPNMRQMNSQQQQPTGGQMYQNQSMPPPMHNQPSFGGRPMSSEPQHRQVQFMQQQQPANPEMNVNYLKQPGSGARMPNPQEPQHRQVQFMQQQQPGNPEMNVNYLKQPGSGARMPNPQGGQHIHNVPIVTVSQPPQFQNPPSAEPNQPSNAFGGLGERQPPGMLNQNQTMNPPFQNPGSTSLYAPNSVGAGHNPPSAGQLAPGSVGLHNPTSIGTHGPTSIPQHAPTSVNHPTSVGLQGPTSVHAGPTSVGGPGSLQTAGPGSVHQEKLHPSSSQVIDFSFPAKTVNPVLELKDLILKDLRRSTRAVNDQILIAIKQVQEQNSFAHDPHSLFHNNPLSTNPESIHNPQSISGPKSIDDSLHRKAQKESQKAFSLDTYNNVWAQFLAVCDKIEARASLLIDAYRLQSKIDSMCEFGTRADVINGGFAPCIQPFLEAVRADRTSMLDTVKLLSDSLREFRKLSDEGEFMSVASKGALPRRYYEKIQKDAIENYQKENPTSLIVDLYHPNSPPPKKVSRKRKRSTSDFSDSSDGKRPTQEQRKIEKMKQQYYEFLSDSEESLPLESEDDEELIADERSLEYYYANTSSKDCELSNINEPKQVVSLENKESRSEPPMSLNTVQQTPIQIDDPFDKGLEFRISSMQKPGSIQQIEPAKAEMLGYDDDLTDEECDPPPPPKV